MQCVEGKDYNHRAGYLKRAPISSQLIALISNAEAQWTLTPSNEYFKSNVPSDFLFYRLCKPSTQKLKRHQLEDGRWIC